VTSDYPTEAGAPTDSLVRAIAAAPAYEVRARPAIRLHRGDEVDGLFEIRRELGRGGMGAVYEAYDRDLDRIVALKVHTRPDGEATLRRMRREARAMARVVHPNVLTVHRVGTHQGSLYIAMEYAPRGTLRQWLQQPRTTAQILDLFAEAALGLHAAHRAGLVHRDFKPDNVLIDDEGRPKVADFGLANPASSTAGSSVTDGASPTIDGDNPATMSRQFVGTPAYMAPEQFYGLPLDGRTDQFALCVALHEALYGVRPFDLEPVTGLVLRIEEGMFRELPTPLPRVAPPRVRAVLRRGLQPRASDRFADMGQFVRALQRARTPSQRRRGWAAVGLVALTAGGVWWARTSAPACRDPNAELRGVWDESRRATLRSLGGPDPAAAAAGRVLVSQLDRYAEQWTAQWQDTCTAGNSPAQMSCLHRARGRLLSLVQNVEHIGGSALASATIAVDTLPAPRDCITAEQETPARPEVAALEAEISAYTDERVLGRAVLAIPKLRGALDRALVLEDPRLAALANQQLALALDDGGRPEEATPYYRAAVSDALESGHAVMTALSMSALMSHLAEMGEVDEVRQLRPMLVAVHRRIDDRWIDGLLASDAANYLGILGEYDEAAAQGERAVDIWTKLRGTDSPSTLRALHNLMLVYRRMRRLDEARASAERLVAGTARVLGEHSPQSARAMSLLAEMCAEIGDLECATSYSKRSQEVLEALGAVKPALELELLHSAMVVQKHAGERERALEIGKHIASRSAQLELPANDLAVAQGDVAVTLADLGRFDEALPYALRSRAKFVEALGEDDAMVAYADTILGTLYRQLGDLPQSLAHLQSAADLAARVFPESHAGGINTTIELGHTQLALGRAEAAEASARAALERISATGVRKAQLAEARFLLARALGPESTEARSLAALASAAYGELGPNVAAERAEIEAWLRAAAATEETR
jgi:serine/threonine-protein kinase